MIRHARGRVIALVFAATSLFASVSYADNPDFFENRDKDGQKVIFGDDPLSAGAMGPEGGKINVRPRAARMALLQPRVHFIPEMLKSVENL